NVDNYIYEKEGNLDKYSFTDSDYEGSISSESSSKNRISSPRNRGSYYNNGQT
ncbi:11223_t:CDS:1, partial [Scutellospora calospora]